MFLTWGEAALPAHWASTGAWLSTLSDAAISASVAPASIRSLGSLSGTSVTGAFQPSTLHPPNIDDKVRSINPSFR